MRLAVSAALGACVGGIATYVVLQTSDGTASLGGIPTTLEPTITAPAADPGSDGEVVENLSNRSPSNRAADARSTVRSASTPLVATEISDADDVVMAAPDAIVRAATTASSQDQTSPPTGLGSAEGPPIDRPLMLPDGVELEGKMADVHGAFQYEQPDLSWAPLMETQLANYFAQKDLSDFPRYSMPPHDVRNSGTRLRNESLLGVGERDSRFGQAAVEP